jgi:hypothetical protein
LSYCCCFFVLVFDLDSVLFGVTSIFNLILSDINAGLLDVMYNLPITASMDIVKEAQANGQTDTEVFTFWTYWKIG